jgi:hypothetical protein
MLVKLHFHDKEVQENSRTMKGYKGFSLALVAVGSGEPEEIWKTRTNGVV